MESNPNDTFSGRESDPGSRPNDLELVHLAQKEDQRAVGELIRRYQGKVYRIAYRMAAADSEEAKDLTQDTFLRAFRNIRKFNGNSSFYTWLYRIAVNTCLGARKRRSRWHRFFPPWRRETDEPSRGEAGPYPPGNGHHGSDPLAAMRGRELERDVYRAMRNLSKNQQMVFHLKVFEEMTVPEISRLLDLAEGTVKSHLFRATQSLRDQLHEWTDIH